MATIDEDITSSSPGRDLLLRNLRKVLIAKGYAGDALEQRMKVVLARDPSRLASIFSDAAKAEARALGTTAAAKVTK